MSILSTAWNGEQLCKWLECPIDAARLDQAAPDSAAIPSLGEAGDEGLF
jgi:hypothetical protein